jgi:hypothetical protein
VLTPQVVLEAGFQGRLQGDAEASVTQEARFNAGLGYRDGTFGGFSDSDSDFSFEQPVYGAALNARATAGPRLEVLLYGAVGPFASAEAYVELSASAEGPPACTRGVLNAGLTAKAGVSFLADYETTLLNEAFPLASFDSCDTSPGAPRPAITWARTFRRANSQAERARAVVEASDGTYLVVGESSLFGSVTASGASLWALRLDALGNVVWQKAFSGAAVGGLARAVQEVQGGFVIASSRGLLKVDTGGNLHWARSYDGDGFLDITSLAAHPDGSLVVAGQLGQPAQAWAMKVDASGQVLWSRRLGGTRFNRVRLTADGGDILVGKTDVSLNDVYLVKLDAGGGISWQRALNNAYDSNGDEPQGTILDSDEQGLDVVEKPGGGYMVAAETYGAFPLPEPGQAGHYAVWVAELDATGAFVGRGSTVVRAPMNAQYCAARAVAVRANGTALVAGRRADTSTDLFVRESILLVQGGAINVLDGGGNDFLPGEDGSMPLQLTRDGGFILAATSDSFTGRDELWLVKLGRTANIQLPYLSSLTGASYVNGLSSSLSLSTAATNAQMDVRDVTGQGAVEVTGVESVQQAP